MKEGRVTSHKLIVSIFDLVVDSNGIAVIRILCCNLHTIYNHCAINERVQVMIHIIDFDKNLTLTFDSTVILMI